MADQNTSDKHVFGGTLVARLNYVKGKRGSIGLEDLLNKMSENGYTGPKYIDQIKLGDKYPILDFQVLLKSYSELFGEEALDDMSRNAPKRKGIVGWLIRWGASPDVILNKAGEYWPHFYDFGKITGKLVNTNKGRVIGFDIYVSPLMCRSLTHYFLGVLENTKIKNAKSKHTKCVDKGDRVCEWELTWE
jgi:hypothetical protein